MNSFEKKLDDLREEEKKAERRRKRWYASTALMLLFLTLICFVLLLCVYNTSKDELVIVLNALVLAFQAGELFQKWIG